MFQVLSIAILERKLTEKLSVEFLTLVRYTKHFMHFKLQNYLYIFSVPTYFV